MSRLEDFRGAWALVTGASSGIGRAFAKRLAAAGLHVALVARRQNRLESLAAELREKGVEARLFPMDLARPGAAQGLFEAVEKAGLPIRLLCNIAGVDDLGEFEKIPLSRHRGLMFLNMFAPVELCHLFHDGLAQRAPSAVINASSTAADQPVPYMSVYAASKAFLRHFSESIYGEWREQGILVQALMIAPTATEIPALAVLKAHGVEPKLQRPEAVVDRSIEHLARGSHRAAAGRPPIHERFFGAVLPVRIIIKAIADKLRPAAKKNTSRD